MVDSYGGYCHGTSSMERTCSKCKDIAVFYNHPLNKSLDFCNKHNNEWRKKMEEKDALCESSEVEE